MDNPIENYWKIRLQELKSTLEGNNFEVFLVRNTAEAKTVKSVKARTVSVIPGL